MSENPETPVRFTFGVPSTHGIVLSLDLPRLAALGAGTVTAAIALMARLPVPVAVAAASVGLALAYGRIQGMALIAWVGPIASYGARALLVRHRCRVGLPAGTLAARRSAGGEQAARPADVPPRALRLPSGLGRGEIAQSKMAARALGVVCEPRSGALGLSGAGWELCAVLEVASAAPFALRERSEQVEAIAAWAEVLSDTCAEAGSVHALQWVERCVPDVAGSAAAWMADHLAEDIPPKRVKDYAALLERLDARSAVHEVYIAVSVRPKARSRDEAISQAVFEVQLIATRLSAIGFEVTPLDADGLYCLLRAGTEGVARAALPAHQRAGPITMAQDERWDAVRADGLWHRTMCVAAWPRTEVGPAWLEPLLVAASPGALRTLAVHLHPTPPSRSRRRVTVRRTTAEANLEQRRMRGWLVGAQERREAEEAARRDAELVAGYGEHRIAAVVTVSAATEDALEAATRNVEAAAGRAGIALRTLYGRQADGLTATLPLCRLAMRSTGGF